LVGKSWSQDWLTAAGVTVFILFALSSSKASSLLGSRVLLFLGAISYSLYLFHALILKSVVTLYGNQYPLVMLLLLSGILSLGVGWMSWKWIEVPSIALARSFSAKVNKCLASN
jgi:peptidoglycan/LPS O-acetylase OafA/YrhL